MKYEHHEILLSIRRHYDEKSIEAICWIMGAMQKAISKIDPSIEVSFDRYEGQSEEGHANYIQIELRRRSLKETKDRDENH